MVKSKFIFIVVFSFFTFACASKDSKKNKLEDRKVKLENQFDLDSCMRRELASCIISYLNETDSMFPEFVQIFYSIYFFEKDEKDFFTIWGYNSLPFYIEKHNPSYTFTYTLFKIEDRNIILVKRNDSTRPKLYNMCDEKTGKDKLNQIEKEEYDIIYDGSWFPRTYGYFLKKDNYIISESDSLYVDFLGNDFLRFEELLKKAK
jgi:hypothetical protein